MGKSIFEQYHNTFEAHLATLFSSPRQPANLYAPIQYTLNLKGKRIRPLLTLASTDLFEEDYTKALGAATAVEVFHNFTLIHDDIMDNAPLRRGKPTVHEKWNKNIAVLSGDAMMIMVYTFLSAYEAPTFKALSNLLSETALQVCEGQQYDMDFEKQPTVTYHEYEHMIAYKTAVLIGAAMKMGAIVAKTSTHNQDESYRFGYFLGLAFQLQDDYLDAFGSTEAFGKQIGGDIIKSKKTALYVKALEFLPNEKKHVLVNLYATETTDFEQKIATAKAFFIESGAVDFLKNLVNYYTEKAFLALKNMEVDTHKKQVLMTFGQHLMQRHS